MKPRVRRTLLAGAASLCVIASVATAADDAPEGMPAWAFPAAYGKQLPGSTQTYGDAQIFGRTSAVDWFPDEHPPMPPSVGGHLPLYACGFCHLPDGNGRPENAALAGLPADYIRQQVEDMRTGARKPADSHFAPATYMQDVATHPLLTKKDVADAARYFSALKYRRHVRVVESADIPHAAMNSSIYVFDAAGAREPLGQRIVEGADDFALFQMRDPRSTFTAYVPPGSVAHGAQLVKGDGSARLPCESCHGAGLRGGAIGPPIAGRSPTVVFRQLYAFQSGARHGQTAVLMQPIVAKLPQREMIALAAYVGSLDP